MSDASGSRASSGGAARRSPFEGHQGGDRPNRAGQIGVSLGAGTLGRVIQIATWPSGVDGLNHALGAALDCAVPARTGDTQRLARGLLIRSGPEELLLLSEPQDYTLSSMRLKIAPDIGSVTDLSHARCRIRVEGGKCRDTLSKLFALDLRQEQFGFDQVRLTGHHHVPSMLHRRGLDAFDIYVFTTYARDQLLTLVDAALEYGVSVAP